MGSSSWQPEAVWNVVGEGWAALPSPSGRGRGATTPRGAGVAGPPLGCIGGSAVVPEPSPFPLPPTSPPPWGAITATAGPACDPAAVIEALVPLSLVPPSATKSHPDVGGALIVVRLNLPKNNG